MTLTFELPTRVLQATLRIIMVNNYAKLFQIPFMQLGVMVRTRYDMPIFDLYHTSVTLTFELLTQVLRATHRIMVVNNYAKLF